jgi:lipid A ethanolaminephosphotransferase
MSALIIAVICLFSFSDAYAVFFRQHKPVRFYTNPTYALYSVGELVAENSIAVAADGIDLNLEMLTTAASAFISPDHSGHELVIMVIGETARSDRFSLNGYPRVTNPHLAKERGVVSYTNISSCGTSTGYSVPCIFSSLSRDDYSQNEAAGMENVLDVLTRVGVSVLWRDNNSSSKGVADRIEYENFRSPDINPSCDTECRDVGMLDGLQAYIDAKRGDILIVLHQMGSHGPAYFKRYPPEFELFTPACKTEDISQCSDEEVGNAYDNTIVYTDYFLSKVIQLLKSNTPKFETAMLYVSDHGESLGEKGMYLHGIPYAFAPKEQTEVPLIFWLGESSDIDLASAINLSEERNSHDAVFHALLAAFEVENVPETDTKPLFLLTGEDVK